MKFKKLLIAISLLGMCGGVLAAAQQSSIVDRVNSMIAHQRGGAWC